MFGVGCHPEVSFSRQPDYALLSIEVRRILQRTLCIEPDGGPVGEYQPEVFSPRCPQGLLPGFGGRRLLLSVRQLRSVRQGSTQGRERVGVRLFGEDEDTLSPVIAQCDFLRMRVHPGEGEDFRFRQPGVYARANPHEQADRRCDADEADGQLPVSRTLVSRPGCEGVSLFTDAPLQAFPLCLCVGQGTFVHADGVVHRLELRVQFPVPSVRYPPTELRCQLQLPPGEHLQGIIQVVVMFHASSCFAYRTEKACKRSTTTGEKNSFC